MPTNLPRLLADKWELRADVFGPNSNPLIKVPRTLSGLEIVNTKPNKMRPKNNKITVSGSNGAIHKVTIIFPMALAPARK